MDENQAQEAISLALAAEEGEAFELGGKTFHLSYISVDAEQKLYKLLLPRLQTLGADAAMTAVFSAVVDLLPAAAAIILGDQDPSIDEAWVKAIKGKGTSQKLFDLTLKTFVLCDLGKFLLGILQSAGLLSSLNGK